MCDADKVECGLSMDPCGRVQDLGPAKRLLGCWVESRQGDVEASVVSSGRRPQPSRAGLTPPFAVPPSRRLASGGGGLGHSPARLHRLCDSSLKKKRGPAAHLVGEWSIADAREGVGVVWTVAWRRAGLGRPQKRGLARWISFRAGRPAPFGLALARASAAAGGLCRPSSLS